MLKIQIEPENLVLMLTKVRCLGRFLNYEQYQSENLADEERDENGSELYRYKESYGMTANTKGYNTKRLMTRVGYSLGGKRGRGSFAAVRGSLKLTIRLSTKERNLCFTWSSSYAYCSRHLSDGTCLQISLFPIVGCHTSVQNQRHVSKGYYIKLTNSVPFNNRVQSLHCSVAGF